MADHLLGDMSPVFPGTHDVARRIVLMLVHRERAARHKLRVARARATSDGALGLLDVQRIEAHNAAEAGRRMLLGANELALRHAQLIEQLLNAAQQVIDCWEHGDLAAAVRELQQCLTWLRGHGEEARSG
jgi:hypothetical protein